MAKIKQEKTMEAALWESANKLRGAVEPAEYKHVVLSLIFLKYANDKFEERRQELIPMTRIRMKSLILSWRILLSIRSHGGLKASWWTMRVGTDTMFLPQAMQTTVGFSIWYPTCHRTVLQVSFLRMVLFQVTEQNCQSEKNSSKTTWWKLLQYENKEQSQQLFCK